MRQKVKVSDIVGLNPQINEDQLMASIELCRSLRSMGIKKRGYNIASAYGGNHLIPLDETTISQRLIRTQTQSEELR